MPVQYAGVARPGVRRIRWRTHLEGYLFIAPWLIGFVLFTLGPMIASALISFTNFDILTPARWAGLANYVRLINDRLFLNTVYNTLFYTILAVPTQLVIALGLALLLIFSRAGPSFYYFDMEHSALSIDAVAPIATAAKHAGIVPIAGPSGIADYLVSRPLDNGAMGVIVPHVTTRAETELIVNACLYAPRGTRGLLNFGALTDFEMADPAQWVDAINRETLVAVKVEGEAGINNIDAMASVPGLTAILIGPGDLSASLGIPGASLDHPRMKEAIEAMLAACERNGIAGGPHVSDRTALANWVERGARFFSYSFDGAMLLDGAHQAVCQTRDVVGARLL